MPKRAWLLRSPKAALERAPQRRERSMASSARSNVAGQAASSSSCMAMSEPRRSDWIWIERSGVSTCLEPSRWLAKLTASSVTLEMEARLITWKPPESVRIGRSQRMNLCSPPSRSTRSAVGRSIR